MDRLSPYARRLRLALSLCLLLGILGAAGCGVVSLPAATTTTTTTTTPPRTPGTHQNIAYGPLTGETLDLCIPPGANSARPGVILIHGGGWSGGDKSAFESVCTYLAAHGFVAAAVNYRLGPAHHWPAQLVDVQLAMRWLRAQAGSLGLDPTRVCSYGSSAGGHLAVFLGVLPAIHTGDEAGLYADQSPAASCVVDEFGPVDLANLDGSSTTPTPVQQQALHALFGSATPQSDPQLYRDASPIDAVSPSSAPVLIVQGAQDTTVPPAQSQELQNALQQSGVPVQYIAYPGGHGFSGLSTDQVRAIELQTVVYLTAQEHP